MRISCIVLTLLIVSLGAHGQDNEITPYTVEEINTYLDDFKKTYKDKKAPQDDAIAILANLRKAYRFLESKGDKATKEELKLRSTIIKAVAKGLKARKRPLVSLECARTLGEVGDPAGAKPLGQWMEKTVLKEKSPNPQWVQYGFQSMAWIGASDKGTLDMMRSFATGKHNEITVADHALHGVAQWRKIKGKDRKELFEKILQYLGGLYSGMKGSDAKKRATYEQRYNTVKDKGLETLWMLSGNNQKFGDPNAANDWWKKNKKRKWADYIGPRFRKKTTKKAPEKKS